MRLGEHDLTTDTEARHVDIRIAKVCIDRRLTDGAVRYRASHKELGRLMD